MAKSIMQFRYYDKGDSKNQPNFITLAKLKSGNIFSNFYPITQMTIQTLPGTKFYLNRNKNPIIVGPTGVYKLNLEGLAEINSLTFNETSLETIQADKDGYLIIDIVYGM